MDFDYKYLKDEMPELISSNKEPEFYCAPENIKRKNIVNQHRIVNQILETESSSEIMDKIFANKEWCSNFLIWFDNMRSKTHENNNVETCDVLNMIKNRKDPEIDKISKKSSIHILKYLKSKTEQYTPFDLTWIYSGLLFLGSLIDPETTILLQELLRKISSQITLTQETDHIYSNLCVIAIILKGKFLTL